MLRYLSTDGPVTFLLLAVSVIGAIALHEYAHALAADLQGDRLPRALGRVTLNPAKHLDPLGTILIFLVGFGWGKPVEFRPEALSSKRFGAAIVALAGPMMNLLLAVAAAFVLVPLIDAGSAGVGARFLSAFFSINLLLAVFNLLPLPPLDGSRLLTVFLPPSKQNVIYFLDRYGMIILLAIVLFGWATILEPVLVFFRDLILQLAGLDGAQP
ncbi:MAG TPA: site-2 protease family protein [Actinomycetota bacterium]|nr:site-2 protease family protein [Actinomycetota bacterium]